MSQHQSPITCSCIGGIDGDLQVVHSHSSLTTLIDVQSVHFDVSGRLKNDHSTIRLGYDAVRELAALLDQIAEPPEPRQRVLPALWSESTFSERPRPMTQVRYRRRRAA